MRNYFTLEGKYSEESFYNFQVHKAQESYIFDTSGKKYLDLRSGLWNVSLGYKKELFEEISMSISDLFEKGLPYLDSSSYNHNLYNELSDSLLKFLDNQYGKCFFTNSGSESTELALKICSTISQTEKNRVNVLAFKDSYHGTFFGNGSISGIDSHLNLRSNIPLDRVEFIDFPKSTVEEQIILDYLSSIIDDYDVFFIEPILASAGVLFSSTSFIDKILHLCSINEVITVFDEVAVGFYRSGSRFYINQLYSKPDIICLSKAINNGILPFGSICIKESVQNRLKDTDIYHFSTQNGNLLSIITALKTIQFYSKNEKSILNNINKIKTVLLNYLDSYSKNLTIRTTGCMLSIQLRNKDPFELMNELKSFGILIYPYENSNDRGISIFPSYYTSIDSLDKALSIILKKIIIYEL